MSAFQAIAPETKAQYEVFCHELVKLMQVLSSSPHYRETVASFIATALNGAPSTHKAFEKSLVAAIQAKDSEEKAAREKAEGKQRGLGKFRGFANETDDAPEEESAAIQQVYTEEELKAMAEAEEKELKAEREREAALAEKRADEMRRRQENEAAIKERERKVDANDAQAKMLALGFEVAAPAWDDKKKGKKGKR